MQVIFGCTPSQYSLRCNTELPHSLYSPNVIHICSLKESKEAAMDPPIHGEYLRVADATTLMVQPCHATCQNASSFATALVPSEIKSE